MIDLRPDSPTYKQWFAQELTAENRLLLYIPEKFAHGFQTLADESEVFYQLSNAMRRGVNVASGGTIRRLRSSGRSRKGSSSTSAIGIMPILSAAFSLRNEQWVCTTRQSGWCRCG